MPIPRPNSLELQPSELLVLPMRQTTAVPVHEEVTTPPTACSFGEA